MIDHILILLISLIGVGFDVMAKVMRYKKMFPQLSFANIWRTFFKEEWDSLMVSVLIIVVLQISLYIVKINGVKIPSWIVNWGMYVFTLVINYSGQRLAYKYLGTAEKVLEEKADKIKLS